MRVRLHLVAVVLALLVPAFVLARWTLAAGAPGEPIPPPSLPGRVGEWRATSGRVQMEPPGSFIPRANEGSRIPPRPATLTDNDYRVYEGTGGNYYSHVSNGMGTPRPTGGSQCLPQQAGSCP